MTSLRLRLLVLSAALIVPCVGLAGIAKATASQGKIAYENGYVDGKTVTIGITPGGVSSVPVDAQAELFLVVYPTGFETLGIGTPQCNPCDHFGDGIDPTDFHDHVLGGLARNDDGVNTPIRHLFLVQPAYTGDPAHDASVTAAYAGHLPAKSAAAVMSLVSAKLNDGSPVATISDTNIQVLATVVSNSAVH